MRELLAIGIIGVLIAGALLAMGARPAHADGWSFSSDEDNSPPVWAATSTVLTLERGSAIGTPVGDPVQATDPDGDAVQYYMAGCTYQTSDGVEGGADAMYFDVDEHTGQIMVNWASYASWGPKSRNFGEFNFCVLAFDIGSDGWSNGGVARLSVKVDVIAPLAE